MILGSNTLFMSSAACALAVLMAGSPPSEAAPAVQSLGLSLAAGSTTYTCGKGKAKGAKVHVTVSSMNGYQGPFSLLVTGGQGSWSVDGPSGGTVEQGGATTLKLAVYHSVDSPVPASLTLGISVTPRFGGGTGDQGSVTIQSNAPPTLTLSAPKAVDVPAGKDNHEVGLSLTSKCVTGNVKLTATSNPAGTLWKVKLSKSNTNIRDGQTINSIKLVLSCRGVPEADKKIEVTVRASYGEGDDEVVDEATVTATCD